MLSDLREGKSLDDTVKKGNSKGPGLTSKLLTVGKVGGQEMTLDQIAASLTILLVAGHDTTANTLAFAIHELSLHKDKEQRLLQEVDGLKNLEEASDEDLSSLPYTNAVITETLRLYAPVVNTWRNVQTDNFKVEGYHIPKNTVCILPVRAIHLSERYYDRPLEFIPERWLVRFLFILLRINNRCLFFIPINYSHTPIT